MINLNELNFRTIKQYLYYNEKYNNNYIITVIEHNDSLKYAEVWVNHYDEGNASHVVGIYASQCPKNKDYKEVLLNAAIEYINREA